MQITKEQYLSINRRWLTFSQFHLPELSPNTTEWEERRRMFFCGFFECVDMMENVPTEWEEELPGSVHEQREQFVKGMQKKK